MATQVYLQVHLKFVQEMSNLLPGLLTLQQDQQCQLALKSEKKNIYCIACLRSPIKGKPPVLHIIVLDHSLGALSAQESAEEKEITLYYLSQTFIDQKERYSPIEKACLTLIFTVQKLHHYLQHHQTRLIFIVDPLTYILNPLTCGQESGQSYSSSMTLTRCPRIKG